MNGQRHLTPSRKKFTKHINKAYTSITINHQKTLKMILKTGTEGTQTTSSPRLFHASIHLLAKLTRSCATAKNTVDG